MNTSRPDFEQQVLRELLWLHARVLRRMPAVQTLLVVGMALLVLPFVEFRRFLGWSLLTIVMECLRFSYAGKILRDRLVIQPQIVHIHFIVLAALAGATVGQSAVWFMPHLDSAGQALLSIILFAMPAAGVSVAVSSRPILAAYSIFILVPTTLTWVALYPHQTITAAGLTILYWGFIVLVAADGEQLLRRSVVIRQERDRVVEDLEKRNAEVRVAVKKAEQLSQSRARVLAAASHDLRQPLHALSVYSAVLAANPAGETLPEIARNIDRLVRSLGGLLHGLLDLSRLSTEHYRPERRHFSLSAVIDEVCNDYATAIADKRLCLIRELDPIRLYDDPLAVARIARNLLDNAVKYTDSGTIRVATSMENSCAVLSVIDSGKGIPLVEQHRIFEEFYQLDNPGRDHNQGVGLGLAIVQRLAERIQARITVTSAPQVGSRFIVRFSNPPVTAPATAEEPQRQPPAHWHGKRVYVIDDEIHILDSTAALLRNWTLDAATAASPATAEALFKRTGKPDLLLVDLRLRDPEHGIDLARRMQTDYGTFPVLVITGETTAAALATCRQNAYPLLQKPIAAEILFDELVRLWQQVGGQHR